MANIDSYEKLKKAPTQEIIQLFGEAAKQNSIKTLEFLRNELALREAEELNGKVLLLTEDMQKKTEAIHDMTKTIKILTAVNMLAVIAQIIVALCKS